MYIIKKLVKICILFFILIGCSRGSSQQIGFPEIVLAVMNGENVAPMLQDGVDPNVTAIDHTTALWHAARKGQTNNVLALIDAGAKLNIQSKHNSMTPLMAAVYTGHKDIVEILLNNGADLNLLNSDEKSALDIAKEQGYSDIILLLSNSEGVEKSRSSGTR